MKVGNQRPQKEIYIIEIKPSLSGTYPQFIDSQGIPLQILQNVNIGYNNCSLLGK